MKKLLAVFSLLVLLSPLHSPSTVSAAAANGRIAYSFRDNSLQAPNFEAIYTANPDGTNRTRITDIADYSTHPVWSPFGDQIAYTSAIGGPDSDTITGNIYRMNPDGSNRNIVATADTYEELRGVSWSQDGTKIFFVRGAPDSVDPQQYNYTIEVVELLTSNRTVLLTQQASPLSGPVVSPTDSNKILYTNSGVLYTMDATGGNATPITSNNAGSDYFDAQWSPDGTKIAATYLYQDNNSYESKIVIMNADGSGIHDLSADPYLYDMTPAWSPDGTKILYRSDTANSTDIVQKFATDGPNDPVTTIIANGTDSYYSPSWAYKYVSAISNDVDGGSTQTVSQDMSSVPFVVSKMETLNVSGQVGNTTVNAGGTIKGTGSIGTLTVLTNGTLAPGNSPGCLTASNTTLSGTFDAELGGTTPCTGYDQLAVNGTVNLTGSTLNLSRYNDFKPSLNDSFTIIDNDSNDLVTGTFTGLLDDTTLSLNGYTFTIDYNGGDGNDVVLTVTAVAPNAPTAAPLSTSVVPTTPNTGLALFTANPLLTLVSTLISAGALFLAARKYGQLTN